MALELAQVVAGFPLAASFAIAGGIAAFREGRRRSTLNEAIHELRRPLQVLALSLPTDSTAAAGVDSSLRLVAAAVERLEREINGGSSLDASAPVDLRPLVEAAVARWQVRAHRASRALRLRWQGDDLVVLGNDVELEQALDNMISNAFVHGDGAVTVEVCECEGLLLVAVLDRGHSTSPARKENRRSLRTRFSGRARHGHGLRIVRRVAGRHGGSFLLRHSSRGTEARLELPVAGGVR